MNDDTFDTACDAFTRGSTQSDPVAADPVMHPDFALVLVHPAPAVVTRQEWFDMLPDYIVHEWDVQERHVDAQGDSAAALQRVRMEATVLGQDRSGLFVVSDIWLRGSDGWQIWKRHSTPLQASVMPSR
ncbi:MAG: hypothetical protein JWR83_2430 [Aeromicrobium sp.]|nr:hypothetical protein [Aeromicrobium sp.]